MNRNYCLQSLSSFQRTIIERTKKFFQNWTKDQSVYDLRHISTRVKLHRKEVIQPHLPIRLPCYDFTPIICPTLGGWLQKVTPPTSGVTNSRGVTGGVYKARERIHRSKADLRLLATPTSCRRVAACNPNWEQLYGIGSTSRLRYPLYRPL